MLNCSLLFGMDLAKKRSLYSKLDEKVMKVLWNHKCILEIADQTIDISNAIFQNAYLLEASHVVIDAQFSFAVLGIPDLHCYHSI